MSSFNILQLEDRARDVDPDLRYMALEDFQKGLNDPKLQVRGAARFTPLLFNLLHDSTTEVQNQAVKSFAPLVRHVNDNEILRIVEDLYAEVEKASNTSKFSTSVPNLALRSVFNDAHSRFSKALSKRVVDFLLPQIFALPLSMTIDKIELLIDLIKCLGFVLTEKEILTIVLSLAENAFSELGIISKRSIVAVDSALDYISQVTLDQLHKQTLFYDQVVQSICAKHDSVTDTSAADGIFFSLLQVVLAQVKKTKRITLSEDSALLVFARIIAKLNYQNLLSEIDVEDLDIDVLSTENLIREDALITLSSFLPCIPYDWFFHTYSTPITEIISAFISYDPLAYQDESDMEDYGDSEIEFSDDEIEQFDETSDSDGLASRLRLQAIVLLDTLLQTFPKTLLLIYHEELFAKAITAISDRNEPVSNQAIVAVFGIINSTFQSHESLFRTGSDVSMVTEGKAASRTPESQLQEKYCPQLETTAFDVLLTQKNISRFSSTKMLLESLISNLTSSLSELFLSQLLDRIREFSLSIKVYADIVNLYRCILTSYDFDTIPRAFVDYILQDVVHSLEDTSLHHSLVIDILQVCTILFRKASHDKEFQDFMNSTFFSALAEKITVKHYSSDVRQHLLGALSELIINIPLTQENAKWANNIFQESLDYEVTVNFTIENLINVCDKKPQLFSSQELCNLIIKKLNMYLGSSDSSLYADVLLLLDKLFEKTQAGDESDMRSLTSNVMELIQNSTDQNLISRAFKILGHTLDVIPADLEYFETLITKIINVKLVDVDDFNLDTFEFLIKQIAAHNTSTPPELFAIGMRLLTLKLFVSAKTMALIASECQLVSEIQNIESELVSYCQNNPGNIHSDKIVFDINFLGCASFTDMVTVSFDDFYAILTTDASDVICLAAARSLGLSIVRDMKKHLQAMLSCYQHFSAENNPKAKLLLVAIKQVLKEGAVKKEVEALRSIWDSLIQVISTKQGVLVHKDVSELRLAGDVLTRVTAADNDEDYQSKISQLLTTQSCEDCNEFLVYTIIVVIKQLMSRTSDVFDVGLMEKILQFLPKSNIEMKQAIISTLLTGIYNKSLSFSAILNDIILPRIYDELSPKEEFKKVIPMGPYKYVVDEGLEVRKLSYELISAIIDLDTSKIRKEDHHVDQVGLFEVLLAKGLNDSENDIIGLTVANLLQIIQNNENVITKISNQQEFIASLTKLMNRKLRSKASTQELESYEDTLRSTIRLSKVIHNILVQTNTLSSEWSNYYNELKNKHYLLFSAVEI